MGRKYTRGVPDVVVVGSASRDIAADDPRGWRLGGGVSYTALTTARLGLRTAALVGVDELAAEADELRLLREAGVEVVLVRLVRGPVFENIEQPGGRVQNCLEVSDPIPPGALSDSWRRANGWILTPVAGEIPTEWSDVAPDEAIVAVGWQGLLRVLEAGAQVRHLAPRPSPVVARADLVGVSRDDLDHRIELAALSALLRSGATLAVTQGDRGGMVMEAGPGGPRNLRHYPAIRTHAAVDPTGAGDVFLAALAAARIEPRLVGGRLDRGFDLLLAAAASSLVLEAPGLLGVPGRSAVARRMGEGARSVVEPR